MFKIKWISAWLGEKHKYKLSQVSYGELSGRLYKYSRVYKSS